MNWNSPEPLFLPRSVAILGAGERPGSWPDIIYRNLTCHGYKGEIYPVNPKYSELWSRRCFQSVKELPGDIDQVIALIPNRAVLPALEEAVLKGCRSAIIVSGGFRESGAGEGLSLENELSAFARESGMVICGPNCVGLLSVATNYLATTYGIPKDKPPVRDGISVVSQSGGFMGNLLQSATDRGIGFRYLVNSGNEAGLDLADYVNYFLDDPETRVICLFIEGVKQADKFLQVGLKARQLRKPIIAMKLGRSDKGKAAALSHTGSMTGSDEVYDAVFHKLGVIRVDDPDELLETAALFLDAPLPGGSGIGVLTNSGGLRGMVCDAAETHKVRLPPLAPATVSALSEFLSVGSVVDNPLDGGWGVISSDENFRRSVELLLQDPNVHLLAMQGKLPEDANQKNARRYEIAAELARNYRKPLVFFAIFSYSATAAGRAFRKRCRAPFLHGLDKSLRAIQAMAHYASRLSENKETSTFATDGLDGGRLAAAQKIMEGKNILTEVESKELLRLYGIPCAQEKLARSFGEAGQIADSIGYPVVLKIVSKDIIHKTEAGGVRLKLRTRAEVEAAFEEMLQKIKTCYPQARIDGVLVQEMVDEGVEVILGVSRDPQFGPVVLFGMGGILVELLKDASFRLPPISRSEADEMIREIKSYRLLSGFRGSEPCDVSALAESLARLGELAFDLKDQILSLDVNPIKVLPKGKGAKVVDALVVPYCS